MLLAEKLLLGCPREAVRWEVSGKVNSKGLFVPGELQRQNLTMHKRTVVYVSRHNLGALTVAEDIASAMNGQIEVTQDSEALAASAAERFVAAPQRPAVTHCLLYLNDQTYLHADGERLAEELRRATAAGSTIKVVMAHENDQKHGGCDFSIFFDGRTPPDLQQSGIYNVSTSATLAANLLRLPRLPCY